MTPPPEPGHASERFVGHVELFQEFFRSRGQHFGSREDVPALATQLAMPGTFHDDLSAIARTVAYRENLQIGRAELLGILCDAIGGPALPCEDPDLAEPVGQLLLFVNVVLLSLKKRPFEDERFEQERSGQEGLEQENGGSPLVEQDTHELSTTPGKGVPSMTEPMEPVHVRPDFDASAAMPLRLHPEGTEGQWASLIATVRDGRDGDIRGGPGSEADSRQRGEGGSGREVQSEDTSRTRRAPAEPLSSPGDRQTVIRRERGGGRLPSLAPGNRKTAGGRVRLLSRPAALLTAVLLACAAIAIFWPRPRRTLEPPEAAAGNGEIQGTVVPKPSPYDTSATGHQTGDSEGLPAEASTDGSGGAAQGTALGAEGVATGNSAATQRHDGRSLEQTPDARVPDSTVPDAAARASPPEPMAPNVASNSSREAAHSALIPEQSAVARDTFSVQHGGHKGLYTVSSGVMGSNLVSAPPPEYPAFAKLTRVEGQVIMQAVVSRKGKVIATHVLQGHYLLRGAAEHAVRNWRYRPYIVNGRPTDVETIVFVEFRLHR